MSSESGELIGYFLDSNLRKISYTLYGETGKTESIFYLNTKQRLILSTKSTSFYDRPFYIDGFKINKVETDSFYFKNNNIIKLIKNGIEIPIDDSKNKSIVEISIKEMNNYLNLLQEYSNNYEN